MWHWLVNMIINAESSVLGRVASFAAKQALLGEDINIVNCEKAVIVGNKMFTIEQNLAKLEIGQIRYGPFFPKRPDLFVKRAIRGMLPRKQFKGRDALSRVRCFIGVPDALKSGNAEVVKSAFRKDFKHNAYITVGELCVYLGGKR